MISFSVGFELYSVLGSASAMFISLGDVCSSDESLCDAGIASPDDDGDAVTGSPLCDAKTLLKISEICFSGSRWRLSTTII